MTSLFKWGEEGESTKQTHMPRRKPVGFQWLSLWEVPHRPKGQELMCLMALEHYIKLQKQNLIKDS